MICLCPWGVTKSTLWAYKFCWFKNQSTAVCCEMLCRSNWQLLHSFFQILPRSEFCEPHISRIFFHGKTIFCWWDFVPVFVLFGLIFRSVTSGKAPGLYRSLISFLFLNLLPAGLFSWLIGTLRADSSTKWHLCERWCGKFEPGEIPAEKFA